MKTRVTTRMVLGALAGVGVVCLLEAQHGTAALLNLSTMTANLVNSAMNILGIDSLLVGAVISRPGVFAYEIQPRCLGILPASALVIAIAIQPTSVRTRLIGISLGLPLLAGLNIGRLIYLFQVGVHRPEYFWFVHHIVWNVLLFAFVVLFFVAWLRSADASGARASMN